MFNSTLLYDNINLNTVTQLNKFNLLSDYFQSANKKAINPAFMTYFNDVFKLNLEDNGIKYYFVDIISKTSIYSRINIIEIPKSIVIDKFKYSHNTKNITKSKYLDYKTERSLLKELPIVISDIMYISNNYEIFIIISNIGRDIIINNGFNFIMHIFTEILSRINYYMTYNIPEDSYFIKLQKALDIYTAMLAIRRIQPIDIKDFFNNNLLDIIGKNIEKSKRSKETIFNEFNSLSIILDNFDISIIPRLFF